MKWNEHDPLYDDMNLLENKRCNKCGKIKPVSEFNKDKRAKDKLRFWCKQCDKEYQKEYQKEYRKIYKKFQI